MTSDTSPLAVERKPSWGNLALFLLFISGLVLMWVIGAPAWMLVLFGFNIGVHGERFFGSLR